MFITKRTYFNAMIESIAYKKYLEDCFAEEQRKNREAYKRTQKKGNLGRYFHRFDDARKLFKRFTGLRRKLLRTIINAADNNTGCSEGITFEGTDLVVFWEHGDLMINRGSITERTPADYYSITKAGERWKTISIMNAVIKLGRDIEGY